MNIAKITGSAIALSLLAAGCVRDASDYGADGGTRYDPTKYITVTASAESLSRGTLVTSEEEMTDFGLFCTYTAEGNWQPGEPVEKMFNERMVKGGAAQGRYDYWKYASGTPAAWEKSGTDGRYTFFAYAPFAAPATNGITVIDPSQVVSVLGKERGRPHIAYTVPAANDAQPDLMVAVRRENLRPTGNPVALQMNHALTAVGFHIYGDGERVASLSVTGFCDTGILELDGGAITWNLSRIEGGVLAPATPIDTDFAVPIDFDPDTDYHTVGVTRDIMLPGGFLMMIPQALTAGAKIKLAFADGTPDITVDLDGQRWLAGRRVVYNITLTEGGTITVTPDNMTLPYTGSNSEADKIEVLCENPGGAPAPIEWTLTSANPEWFRMSTDPAAGFAGSNEDGTVSGTGSQTVYTFAPANGGGATRSTTVSLGGGVVVNVTQLKHEVYDTLPDDPLPGSYVGAFWRTNQTGERIIRIGSVSGSGAAGAWSAYVGWMDGGWTDGDIVFAPGGNPAGDTPGGDAENFQIGGSASALSGGVAGGGSVTFRIGLRSRWDASNTRYDPSKPARYAVIVFSYDNYTKYHRVFLRQGQEPDYLMRPTDPVDGGASGRPLAVKFTPYNLTAPGFKGTGSVAGSMNIGAKGGRWTDYPSQAGALFGWAHTDGVIAYNPAVPPDAPAGFGPDNTLDRFWGATDPGHPARRIRDTYESCPAGYRRPTDGSPTNVAAVTGTVGVGDSELAQSLWKSSATGAVNVLSGYYADGFFDRSEPVANSVVAYGGRLFYNPATGASLFFPLPGYRRAATGALTEPGVTGSYWTSSAPNGVQGRSLYFDGSGATTRSAAAYRQGGYPIRCVQAAEPTLPGDLEPPAPGNNW